MKADRMTNIARCRTVAKLYRAIAKEKKIRTLLTFVRGGRVPNPRDFSSPVIPGNANMGDTIRIARTGATGTVCIVGDDFVGADFGICYAENEHGDYEVIRRASAAE
jgi:hypothetical protein